MPAEYHDQNQISGKVTRVHNFRGGQWNWQESSESIWSTGAMDMHGRAHGEDSEHHVELIIGNQTGHLIGIVEMRLLQHIQIVSTYHSES